MADGVAYGSGGEGIVRIGESLASALVGIALNACAELTTSVSLASDLLPLFVDLQTSPSLCYNSKHLSCIRF